MTFISLWKLLRESWGSRKALRAFLKVLTVSQASERVLRGSVGGLGAILRGLGPIWGGWGGPGAIFLCPGVILDGS